MNARLRINTEDVKHAVTLILIGLFLSSSLVAAALTAMLMTGRTSVDEIKFYIGRTSVDLFEKDMGLYSMISSWMTVNFFMWTTVILFIVGTLCGVIMAVVGSIRDRRNSVKSAIMQGEYYNGRECWTRKDLVSK